MVTTNSTESRFFNNGTLFSTGTGGLSSDGTSGDYAIGNHRIATQPINGTIDEVAIWNRSVTIQEISDLYNTGRGMTYRRGDVAVISPAGWI